MKTAVGVPTLKPTKCKNLHKYDQVLHITNLSDIDRVTEDYPKSEQ